MTMNSINGSLDSTVHSFDRDRMVHMQGWGSPGTAFGVEGGEGTTLSARAKVANTSLPSPSPFAT
jgi:hypothetical protein